MSRMPAGAPPAKPTALGALLLVLGVVVLLVLVALVCGGAG